MTTSNSTITRQQHRQGTSTPQNYRRNPFIRLFPLYTNNVVQMVAAKKHIPIVKKRTSIFLEILPASYRFDPGVTIDTFSAGSQYRIPILERTG